MLNQPQLMMMHPKLLSSCHHCPKTRLLCIHTGLLHQILGLLVHANVRDVAKRAKKDSGKFLTSKLVRIFAFPTQEFHSYSAWNVPGWWKRQLGV